MSEAELLFVGALNRPTPYFQGARGVGLSVFRFDPRTLAAEKITETNEIDNPTFVSVTPDGRFVYASSEVAEWREGTVSAYRFERETGRLRYLNKQAARGSITAQHAISRDGSKLLVVNYGDGEGGPDQSLVVFPLESDGHLGAPRGSARHEGRGPNAARQERPHAHSVTELPGNLALVADLGIDQLVCYAVGADGAPTRRSAFGLAPGSGPRHVALHPNGRLVFVINELDSTVASLSLDGDGRLALLDTQPAVPAGTGGNHCSDIQISPDGRFLYGGNRGHDSIVILEADAQTGRLAVVDHVPCGGATPRNLCLSRSGSFLFCANQNADRIAIFRRDDETGRLVDTGAGIEVGTPMCVKAVSA
ncbi:MAG: lactonase family protein [Methylobacterium mesophilicum]|nr:lactonase family protein [Methylobacterium mesophilicum]